MRSFLSETNHPISEQELQPKKQRIGVLTLEYNSKKTITDPEGKILFSPDSHVIDIHIFHDKNKGEADAGFLSKLNDSLRGLAQYVAENRQSLFGDVEAVRGLTYDAMAKIAQRLGFQIQQIDSDSLGSLEFKILGEYSHTERAKRGKKVEGFYAISMSINQFLEKWGPDQPE